MAILGTEPGADELLERLLTPDRRVVSAGTLIELGIVLEARIGPAAASIIERFLRDGDIEMVPVDREHVDRALEGWRRFGRGRHRAGLNMGDLFAYGLAVTTGYAVLCTGENFVATDVDVIRPEAG